MDEPVAPPGWYGQPDGNERFWTGSQWSDQVRPGPPMTSAAHGQVVPMRPVPTGALANPPLANPRLASPQLAYTQQGYVAVTQVAPKSPGLALVASFFVPGLGQLVNGQVGKGVAMFFAYVVSLLLLFAFIGFVLAPAVWIWSMVDAYSGAQQWNARHGILS